jgi:phosphoribosylglycinamide formyltransferase 1
MRLAFFASHSGSSMKSISTACQNGSLNAIPVICISNNGNSEALLWAKNNGLKIAHLSQRTHPNIDNLYRATLSCLVENDVTHVILSGYMRMIDKRIIEYFENRIINIHPALLPKFGGKGMYGIKVHQAVIEAGETQTGATLHLINEEYDKGPIIAQTKIPIHPNDTSLSLRDRLSEIEGSFYVSVLKKINSAEINLDKLPKYCRSCS